ncbi:hypothetical protein [Halobacillus sp. A5]|uniref:hypothetical protein n=1 Tax=Halobacillus sp. A5 TaxID=2880263 RepID=UPI0020A6686C|nr:hypothetical protein [Halobacillus sp. A5]MCP3025886.1 hypothetical protein [Halobacillus sp. A5]
MKMIRTQPSSRFTVPKWAQWVLLVLGILFVIVSTLSAWMYLHIEDSKTGQYDEVKEFVRSENLLENTSEVSRYNGEFPIHIVSGVNENDEETHVFIDMENKEELASVPAADMIGEQAAKKNVNECSGCEFVDIQLAYEENRPVWEVTYKDESSRYVLEYLDVTNGEEVQRFAFRQT